MKRIIETFTAADDCYEINPIKSNKWERFLFYFDVINKQDCAKNFFLVPWICLLHIDQTFLPCHVIRNVVLQKKNLTAWSVWIRVYFHCNFNPPRLSRISEYVRDDGDMWCNQYEKKRIQQYFQSFRHIKGKKITIFHVKWFNSLYHDIAKPYFSPLNQQSTFLLPFYSSLLLHASQVWVLSMLWHDWSMRRVAEVLEEGI